MSELDIYARQGLGNSSGFGERPALLIVDFVNVLTVVVAGGVGDRAIACTRRRFSTWTGNTPT